MKVYWDEKEKRLVIDLEGEKIEGDFSWSQVNANPLVKNGVFVNTGDDDTCNGMPVVETGQ